MPTVVEPMTAQLAADIPADEVRYGFEFKWDGVRAIASWDGAAFRLRARSRADITGRYPELWPLALDLGPRRAVLDGEVVALDERGRPSFETLQQRMHLTAEADVRRRMRDVPVSYLVFDVLWLDGQLLVDEPYVRRRELLDALGLAGSHWQTPPWQAGGGRAMRRASDENGLEGVIAKRLDSVYETGRRSGAWLKVKNRLRQELVIGGWVPGEGRRIGLPGALLLGYYDGARFVYAGRSGTGLTDAALRELADRMRPLARRDSPFDVGRPPGQSRFVEPRLVAEFEFAEWTQSGTLRTASFKGLRDDRDPRQVVREVPR
jgi:bifunctional non-homologous end joining protein LigD